MVVGIIIAADITAETIKYERIILLKDETLFQAMFAGALGGLAVYFNILRIPLTVLIFAVAMIKPKKNRITIKERLKQEV